MKRLKEIERHEQEKNWEKNKNVLQKEKKIRSIKPSLKKNNKKYKVQTKMDTLPPNPCVKRESRNKAEKEIMRQYMLP